MQESLPVLRSAQNTLAERAPCRIFACYTWWYVEKPLGLKRLNTSTCNAESS